MTVRIGTGLSTEHDPLQAGTEAARSAAEALGGAPVDLTLVFASGAHLAAPEAMLEAVHGALSPKSLIGCGAGGVLAAGRELESGTAVTVWAASFGGAGETAPFQLAGGLADDVEDRPSLDGATGAIVLADPYSFPVERLLDVLAAEAPGTPVVGGVASARTAEGAGALFLDDQVCEQGAVGVSLRGMDLLPCVSQGAAPLGREVTITDAEGNVIRELAGRPALETVEEIIAELPLRERALVAGGLLVGLVIDSGKPEYEQGDFLVRGVLGADPESGSIAVGATVHEGQVVRLHARDAASADDDLHRSLRRRIDEIPGSRAAGAVVFSCNGRGQAMFGACDHDARAVERELGGAPAAGFFAAGEIGPVGGRSFLHGFTATVAVFPA
jgi:small ligand-binding sensory domain FIST